MARTTNPRGSAEVRTLRMVQYFPVAVLPEELLTKLNDLLARILRNHGSSEVRGASPAGVASHARWGGPGRHFWILREVL